MDDSIDVHDALLFAGLFDHTVGKTPGILTITVFRRSWPTDKVYITTAQFFAGGRLKSIIVFQEKSNDNFPHDFIVVGDYQPDLLFPGQISRFLANLSFESITRGKRRYAQHVAALLATPPM